MKTHTDWMPRHIEVSKGILDYLKQNHLHPGEKIPGGRFFAKLFNASKNTIYEALEILQNEGAIEIRRDSGTYVAHEAWYDFVKESLDWGKYIRSGWQQQSRTGVTYLSRAAGDKSNIYFNLAKLDDSFAYFNVFDKSAKEVLSDPNLPKLLNDYHVQGILSFREEIARRLSLKGINTTPANIIITWGITSTIDLLIRALLGRGGTIFTENPSLVSMMTIISSIGIDIIDISSDDKTVDVSELRRNNRKSKRGILLTSPLYDRIKFDSAQFIQHHELMQYCKEVSMPIIEIDYGHYAMADNFTSLKSIDDRNMVIYVGSIALPYTIGMDISWIVVPDYLVDRITDISTQSCHYPYNLNSLIVERMMRNGSYDKFIIELYPKLLKHLKSTDSILEKYLNDLAVWDRRCNKTIIEIRFNDNINVKKMYQLSLEGGIGLVFGIFCSKKNSQCVYIFPISLSMSTLEKGISILRKIALESQI